MFMQAKNSGRLINNFAQQQVKHVELLTGYLDERRSLAMRRIVLQ